MDALEFVRERNRMCKSFGGKCDNCPADRNNCCNAFEWQEDFVAIVEKWSAEHPPKTRQSKLLKIFPDTTIDTNTGAVSICPAAISKSYRDEVGICNQCGVYCRDCQSRFWLEEIE